MGEELAFGPERDHNGVRSVDLSVLSADRHVAESEQEAEKELGRDVERLRTSVHLREVPGR